MAQRRATLKDIATALNVSVNTVSRALAGKDDIGAATQQRVREEAARIGYVPNSLARSLVSGSSGTIGFVITNPSNPLYAELVSGAAAVARTVDKSLVLVVTAEDATAEAHGIESLLAASVDAVMAVPVQSTPEPWKRITGLGVPLTLINRNIAGLPADFVGIDHAAAVRAAVLHVAESGAHRIWAVEEDLQVSTVTERLAGYRRGLEELGPEVASSAREVRVPTRRSDSLALPWQAEEAYEIGTALFREVQVPDALICGTDLFAVGLMKSLQDSGHQVPRDVLVTGMGNHSYSRFLTPALTTVDLPGFELGAAAMRMVLDRLATPAAPPRELVLEAEFLPRESSRR